ncbi:MAG TPA: Asp-tRNA(Asn)/Glu-tRNA(Gln) amidotransferase subunit GatC [Gemmatimonadota bacterium]|nr:Asp-tRNA(Asn)/Glu-tRNA(Gln) amidotransferase subunit GatC [Gemmatimonadota bacterium]
MTVSPEDVRHIARLARLELTDEEVDRFRRELSTILAYVEKLEELEAGSAAEPPKPDQPLREDALVEWTDLAPLHEAAPDFAGGFFRVPRVIE